MICRAIRLATWPLRTAYGVIDEGLWLARAAAEVASYGFGAPDDDEPYVWALSNDQLDEILQ